jgi:ubiquinone/menaquinone biosynthesis C-methylase UbiE
MADRRLRKAAEGFALVARDYERSRPSYPPAAIEFLVDRLGVRPRARACDIGAGTGKFTGMLVAQGLSVVAVEPSRAMRAVLESKIASVEVVDATAEALPFPDGDFDLVTIAQAFHWFHPTEALAEVRRVLRPNGPLAIVDNDLDDRVDWVKELARISFSRRGTRASPAGTRGPGPRAGSRPR